MIYLIGARGRLGQAIASEYANSELISLDRSDYENWHRPGAADKISRYFDKPDNQNATLFIASGLLNPGSSLEDLNAINYLLPKNLIDGAGRVGMKIITFGTVMENLVQSQNPYIHTKVALKEYIENLANNKNEAKALHLQIHTLYGVGLPSSFMFLGQILGALKNNKPFKMTSGRQLREYHHLIDETQAIRKISDTNFRGVLDVSHGKPKSLATIAENIFDAFGKKDLLHIGAIADPVEENYEKILKPVNIFDGIDFRSPIPNIVQYMRECTLHI